MPAPRNFTDDEVRSYGRQFGLTGANGAITSPQAAESLYTAARTYGVGAEQLDRSFGWSPGTSQNWITQNNKQPLRQTEFAPAPAPRPADGSAPMTGGQSPQTASQGQTQPLAATRPAAAPTASPVQVQFNEGMGVAGRVRSLVDENGPLMQQASGAGSRLANSRGVLNSSAGIRAAQDAVISRAGEIAAADANLFNQVQLANMQQANAFASQGRDLDLGYARLQEDARQANMANEREVTLANRNFDLQDRRLTQEDRQFMTQAALEQRKLDAQMAQFAQNFGLSVEELRLSRDRLSSEDRRYYDGLVLERDRLAQSQQQFVTEWENRFSLDRQANAARLDLARLDGTIRQGLIDTEARYRQSIAGNENISNAWGTMMQEIGRIQNNPDLESAAKTTLINNVLNGFRGFAGFWSRVSGGQVDISDLANFGVAPAPSGQNESSPTQPVRDSGGTWLDGVYRPDSTGG